MKKVVCVKLQSIWSWAFGLWFLLAQKISWRQQCNNSKCWWLWLLFKNDKQHLLCSTHILTWIISQRMRRQKKLKRIILVPLLCFLPFHISYQTNLSVTRKKNVLWGTFLWLLTTLSDFPQQVGLLISWKWKGQNLDESKV